MAKTAHLYVETPGDIARAATLLRNGGLVAFATETVYGLGAHALSGEAVAGIFRAKQRPSWDPLIVHLATAADLPVVAHVEGELIGRVQALAAAFWPGPLTLLLPRTAAVPDTVTAGRPLVGVRVPAHPAAQALLRAAGLPLAAPSANRFGHTSPTTAEHVLHDLDGRIDAVLDAGPCSVGVESTVLDPQPTPMVVYRAGAVTPKRILQATGLQASMYLETLRNEIGEHAPESLPSPGVGIRHYAPEALVWLAGATPEALVKRVRDAVLAFQRVGVLLPADWALSAELDGVELQTWGVWSDLGSLAAGLFAGLRSLESREVEVIVCPLPEPGELGDALRDRLLKAAKPR